MSSRFLYFLSALLLWAAFGTYAYLKPVYDWDMLAYAAIQYKHQGLTDEQAHKKVYEELLPGLPVNVQAFLTSEAFDKRSEASVEYFAEQIPFYEIKPFYNGLVGAGCAVRLTPLQSLRMWSGVGYALLTLLVFVILSARLRENLSLLFTALICLLPTVMMSFRLLTPDGLSTVFIVAACVLFLLRSSFHLSLLLLVASIGFRPDNLVVAIIAAIVFQRFNDKEAAWWKSGVYVTVSIGLYAAIAFGFNSNGWKITFQHSIIDLDKPIHEWKAIPLTAGDYVHHLLLSFKKYQLVWLPALFFAALSFISTKALLNRNIFDSKLTAVVIVLAASAVVKYFVFPRFDVRYYVPQFLFAMMLIVLALTTQPKRKES